MVEFAAYSDARTMLANAEIAIANAHRIVCDVAGALGEDAPADNDRLAIERRRAERAERQVASVNRGRMAALAAVRAAEERAAAAAEREGMAIQSQFAAIAERDAALAELAAARG